MAARPGSPATHHHASQVLSCYFGQPQSLLQTDGTEDTFVGSVDLFDSQIPERFTRLSLGETSAGRYAPQPEGYVARHFTHPVGTHEASPMTTMQANTHIDMDGYGAGRPSERQTSLVHGSSWLGGQRGDCRPSDHGETHGPFSPYVAIDLGREVHEQAVEPQKDKENAADPSNFQYRLTSQPCQKSNNADQTDIPQIAEDAFAKIKFWREVYSGFTGMQGVYILANFAFDNPAGGICSLFCFLCSTFAQLDRRAPSYFLTALLSCCFGIVVAVSLSTPVRGFELSSENALLRRICVTQVCLLLLATPVAIIVALRIMKLHNFLREPGVLVPLQCAEKVATDTQHDVDNRRADAAESSGDIFQPLPEPPACGTAVGLLAEGRLPSECNASAH